MSEQPHHLTTRARPAAASILIVDDDPSVRGVLSQFLLAEAYNVETAANGLEGLARLEDGGIDAVLLDMGMPDLDGLALCGQVRRRDRDAYVPIIMLTALDTAAARQAAFALGADDYLTKPVDLEVLLARMELWLRARPPRRDGS